MFCVFSPAGSAHRTCWGNSVDIIRVNLQGASIMGKYFLGWILGVPVIVLVIIYLIFN